MKETLKITVKRQAKLLIPTEFQAVVLGITIFTVALCLGLSLGFSNWLWMYGALGAVVFAFLVNFIIDLADRAGKQHAKLVKEEQERKENEETNKTL